MAQTSRLLLTHASSWLAIALLAATLGCGGNEPDVLDHPAHGHGEAGGEAHPPGGGIPGDKTPDSAIETPANEAATNESPARPAKTDSTQSTKSDSAPNVEPSAEFQPLADKVKFKLGNDKTAYSFKPADGGAKWVDGDEKELARFRVYADRIKVKNPDDSEAGNIRISPTRLKVEGANGEKLCELQRQSDGDWKLDDADEQLVYRIKVRDYGFEIESPDDKSLFKIKKKGDKISVRNPAEETILSTKDDVPLLAVAVLMLEKVENKSLRGAMAMSFALQVGGLKP